MSDLFDKQVPDEWRERVIEVMRDTPHLQYQILTKRPQGQWLTTASTARCRTRCAAVTVELPLYLSSCRSAAQGTGTGPKFISAEPLMADPGSALAVSGISQIIAGDESGHHLCDPALCPCRGVADHPRGKPNAVNGNHRERSQLWCVQACSKCSESNPPPKIAICRFAEIARAFQAGCKH